VPGGGVDVVGALSIAGPFSALTLPIRKRGTRVWMRCSRFFTRARISDTICTPLLRGIPVDGAPINVVPPDGVRGTRVGEVPPVADGPLLRCRRPSAGVVCERENTGLVMAGLDVLAACEA
jgi:hypothetical protein